MKILMLILNLAGGALALVSAWYWYQSTKTNLPDIDPTTGEPKGSIGMAEMNRTLVESAKANKVAACWTAVSALVFGINTILGGIFPTC